MSKKYLWEYKKVYLQINKLYRLSVWVSKQSLSILGVEHICRQNMRFSINKSPNLLVPEQIQHDLELLSRVHICTAQFSLFRDKMTSEIAACGIAACAVVIFSNEKKIRCKRWQTRKVLADGPTFGLSLLEKLKLEDSAGFKKLITSFPMTTLSTSTHFTIIKIVSKL